ncbi:MAG: SDR family NAD(P)-dependent oxidoreductase [Myxococcota bacterium]
MEEAAHRAIAIVGVSAILPDAPDAARFWQNVKDGRYSIGEVPPERWDPDLYWDPDPKAPNKTYSKIGGFVRDWEWEPMKWKLPIPPKVADAMDESQRWAVACARRVLLDAEEVSKPLDRERTAIVIGTAMAGDQHYWTSLPVFFPEYAGALAAAPSFRALPADVQEAIAGEMRERIGERVPGITEDTMPGELANCMAGRIANLFDFHGPNFVCDAACASALAAIDAAVDGLLEGEYEAALVGGVDRNMGPAPFVKFCKIGALSATGTRPYGDGADGFVMGEGAVFFLLKPLAAAEAAGDRIHAVIRGVAGSSDGKGKGITAPNPAGQRLAVERAWRAAGLAPETATLIEGHGTSTRVGDVVEVETLNSVFGGRGLPRDAIALGSAKSNIGHLKGAAGAAGLLKTVFALQEKVLPPSLNCEKPNPNIDFAATPFHANTELKPWDTPACGVRRAGVSAFGFGGTNFHAVLEEHVPGRLTRKVSSAVPDEVTSSAEAVIELKAPPRGAVVLGADDAAGLRGKLESVLAEARSGRAPEPVAPREADLRAAERLAIDYGDAAELATRAERAARALESDQPALWKALRSQGIHRGSGAPGKVAFLYTGQGSQYVNMLRGLRDSDPVVRETFEEADRVMEPILGRPLSDVIFADPSDADAIGAREAELRRTEITQPAVLTVDSALTHLLASHGIQPDLVMGHSLGEYGALVASGALPFADALEAVAARGHEMASLDMQDNGKLAAVFAPIGEVETLLAELGGDVVIANVNSSSQSVVGGASAAVERVVTACTERGIQAVELPVSHAFHTSIVAPASDPLRRTLERLRLAPPELPVVANVSGELYPNGPGAVPEMLDLLAAQVASPVQFVKGLQTLYEAGARIFVEVGPKKALHGFVTDVLGDRDDVLALFTNHPKVGDAASVNQALCGLWASGLGVGRAEAARPAIAAPAAAVPAAATDPSASPAPTAAANPAAAGPADRRFAELGRLVTEFLERGTRILGGAEAPVEPPVVSGAALGLPGGERVFDDDNVQRILDGEQEIDVIPTRFRHAMVDKHITRLVKTGGGGPHFEAIEESGDVIKLAARGGELNLVEEFGVDPERDAALDVTTRLAIAAGIEALRDAGIPLMLHYRTTTKDTRLPDRWMLPEPLRDETGVIFASAFPGFDAFADELTRYFEAHGRESRQEILRSLRERFRDDGGVVVEELDRRLHELDQEVEDHPYQFDRRFLFRVLPMAHAQFAEHIGARGPNTHLNSACASTTQAFALAEDWIRAGRCRRVVVVAADDATSDRMIEWIGSGFLATGAAATDDVVEDAALPFDRRRHGMILGMGAAGVVIEHAACARERGLRPICEIASTVTANSAFHGTRLDVSHIGNVMERVIAQAEQRLGVDRHALASELLFVSHETYTPARGGSASAEVESLRRVFGDSADRIVVANTKGLTGHPMGVGIEDVVAVKALETGVVPPVPNWREPDPDLGPLNLSKGGAYPLRWALRLGAGFGSQISMSLLRWTPTPDGRRPSADALGYASRLVDRATYDAWLRSVSGDDPAELEVVRHTLRLVDRGPEAAARRRPTALAPAAAPAALPRPAATAAAPTEAPTSPGVSAPAPAPSTAAAAPSPVEAPTADSAAGNGEAAIRQRVLEIVAGQTGYPVDMLDLDLDLEADLGIDTVKQAETFAAIREAWGIPRDENLQLRDYPTLAHAIRFVQERLPGGDETGAPAPAEPARPEAPAADSAAGDGEAAIRQRVLEIVAGQTGYPVDMLDLDLDLEADLGIDTVKQAETFAAIREAWGIPRDENLQLRDYPTLAHAIRFVQERLPGGAAASAVATDEREDAPESEAGSETPGALRLALAEGDLEAAAAIPRRVPTPVLRPPLDWCAATGVSLAKGARVVLMPDASGVASALESRLGERGVEVLSLEGADDRDAVVERIRAWREAGPIQGCYWLAALDSEGDHAALSSAAWQAGLTRRVKLLEAAARALYDELAAEDRFFISASRLGGRHGYGDEGALAPQGGAVVGFVKALARERGEALVKAVDFAADEDAGRLAEALVAETLHDPGAVEIGVRAKERVTLALVEQPFAPDADGLDLGPDSTFVVTGAAGGIVSAIVADLAQGAGGGTFHLLDLVAEPDPGDPELARFQEDRDGLRRDLFERLKAVGERATPVRVERELAGVERAHAAAAAIDAVRRAGGQVRWHSVDLTDGDAVAKALEEVRDAGGADVVLHAAGLERSQQLPDKPDAEFDLVFDVKANGWHHLMRALDGARVGAVVAFSSIAGRLGNAGQTDYAAANDLLCKCVSALRRERPDTRALAIDWTAWGGIGMASRGSIPEIMARAGIDMLPPAAGVALVRQELTSSGRRGEVLLGERLGVLLAERRSHGGLDPEAVREVRRGPLVGEIVEVGIHDGLCARTRLDPKTRPFLHDHEIDDTPVLPGVMGIEAFVELASALRPELAVRSVDDVRFLAPFKFYRREPREIEVRARFEPRGDDVVAHCRLIGHRSLPGRDEPQETLHFSARVRLGTEPAPAESVPPCAAPPEGAVGAQDVYRVYFHGPAFQVLAAAWGGPERSFGRIADGLPAALGSDDSALESRPRLTELAFQTAGVREIGGSGRMGLPQRIASLELPSAASESLDGCTCIVSPADDGVDALVVDAEGGVRVRMRGYATAALPGEIPDALRAPLAAAIHNEGAGK